MSDDIEYCLGPGKLPLDFLDNSLAVRLLVKLLYDLEKSYELLKFLPFCEFLDPEGHSLLQHAWDTMWLSILPLPFRP